MLFLLCFVSCGLCRYWILQQEEGTWGKSHPPHLCFYKWRNCQHFLEKGVLTHWDLTPVSCGSSPEEGSTEKAFLRKPPTITMLSGLVLHRLYRQAGQFSVCQARGSTYRRRSSEIISSGCLTLQKGKRWPRKTKQAGQHSTSGGNGFLSSGTTDISWTRYFLGDLCTAGYPPNTYTTVTIKSLKNMAKHPQRLEGQDRIAPGWEWLS